MRRHRSTWCAGRRAGDRGRGRVVDVDGHDARPAALQVYLVLLLTKAPSPEARRALLTEARATADAAGDQQLSLDFARQLNDLAAPEAPAN